MDADSASGPGRQRPYDSAPLTSGSSFDPEGLELGLSEATAPAHAARPEAGRAEMNPSDASLLTLSSPGVSSAEANTTSTSSNRRDQPSGSSGNNGQNSSSGDNASVAAAVDALSSEAFVAAVAGLNVSMDHSGGGADQRRHGGEASQGAEVATVSVSFGNDESSIAPSSVSLMTRQPSLGSSPTIGSPAVPPPRDSATTATQSPSAAGLSRFTPAKAPTLRTPPPPELPPSPLLGLDSNSPSSATRPGHQHSLGEPASATGAHDRRQPSPVPVSRRPPRSIELPRLSQESWLQSVPEHTGPQRRSGEGSLGQGSDASLGFDLARRALLADVEAAREALKQEEASLHGENIYSSAQPEFAVPLPPSLPVQQEVQTTRTDKQLADSTATAASGKHTQNADLDHRALVVANPEDQKADRPTEHQASTAPLQPEPEGALLSSGPVSQIGSNTVATPGPGDSATLNNFLLDLKAKYRLSGSRSRSSSRSKLSRESGEASVRPSPAAEAPVSRAGAMITSSRPTSPAGTRAEEHTELTLAPERPERVTSADPLVVTTSSPASARVRSHQHSEPSSQFSPLEGPSADWSDINRSLRSLGLPAIQTALPSMLELKEMMACMTCELERKDWMASKAGDALQEARLREENLMAEVAKMEEEVRATRRNETETSNTAGSEAQRDREAALKADSRLKRAESEVNGLRQRMAQLEHSSRAKERVIDKLKSSLAESVTREERREARHKEAYARLKRAAASAKAGRAGAGAASRAVRELRPLEVAGLYEDQLVAVTEENAAVRGELSSMAKQLKDAENVAAEARRGGRQPRPQRTPSEADTKKIYELESRLAEAQVDLKSQAEKYADASRAAARREAELEARCDRLAEENAGLILELQTRPSVQDLRAAKRQVDMLERKVGELRANGGEETNKRSSSTRRVQAAEPLTSKARMRRDKQIHRLELKEVDHLPRDVLVTVLQDSCIAVELSDATQLPIAIAKLMRIVAAVPKMEAFISNCCDSVFRKGCAFLPENLPGQAPQQVGVVLDHWVKLLHRLAELEELRGSVLSHLRMRVGNRTAPRSTGEIIYAVNALVQRERAALSASDTIAAAEETMQDPQGLLQKVLGRYQELFDCPKLNNAMASMNQLYMTLEEARNFRKNLAAMLGLETSSSSAVCIASVQKLLDHHHRTISLKADYVHRLEADQLKHRAEMQQALRRARGPRPEDSPMRSTPPSYTPATTPSETSDCNAPSSMHTDDDAHDSAEEHSLTALSPTGPTPPSALWQ